MPDTPAASRFFACFIPCIWFNASPVLLVLLLLAIIGLGKITRFAAGGLMFPSQIGDELNAQKNRDLSLVIMSNVCDGQKITTDEALFFFFPFKSHQQEISRFVWSFSFCSILFIYFNVYLFFFVCFCLCRKNWIWLHPIGRRCWPYQRKRNGKSTATGRR